MKKMYVFNNWFKKKKGVSFQEVRVEAKSILEAKRKVIEMGHKNMRFETIKVMAL